MRVLLSGGTGLLGQEVLRLLRENGHEVRCLVRTTSRTEYLEGYELSYGDAEDAHSMEKALRDMEAFVHVAGIQYTPHVIEAMGRAGVGRLVTISSTSVHSQFEFRSAPRSTNEKLLQTSDLSWTVVRPSMIYGSELDHNIHHLLRFLDRSPVFPMFGAGANLWQPVYYEDLAFGVVAALENQIAVGKSYDLPGAKPLSYLDLVRTASTALGKTPRIVRLPMEPVRRVLRLVELARIPFPIKSEQVLRLREDKAYSYEKARSDLGYAPRDFSEGVEIEVARLRELGIVKH